MEFSHASHFMALTCSLQKTFSLVQTVGRAGYFSISKRVTNG